MSKINEARVLANNGQYKAVSSGGVVRIMYKGKEIASGDFDSGADGWFVMGKNDKGQKFFGDAQDMVDYFVKNKVTEDAPANATGTAVVGTGDDSSTVVVKKKDKETMKDRLLKRFKIKETIDRTVPDLEIPEDEIKEKVKHLKAMAMQEVDLDEAIKGLQNKAKKTGMPYSILKKVYDRGMAAWRGGHRPGSTQQQWAFARVNSFVTKSSGTWGGADKDLAKKVRGSK